MLLQILRHTPPWVFALFAVLLAAGLTQLSTRRAGLGRLAALPLGMSAWSLYGTVAAFGFVVNVLMAWVLGLALVAGLVLLRPAPAGAAYDPAGRRFTVPGSAWPLALMMVIFFARYATGVAAALSPDMAASAPFITGAAMLYGALSGAFVGRAARLSRLAARSGGQRLAWPQPLNRAA
ncbi:MAG: hypothetical protein JNN03_06990 [Rubrivivax sp.]|nr:hypothetical protein [Rubrivivax sp.]